MIKPFFRFCSSSLLALMSLGFLDLSAIAQEALTDQSATERISVTVQADQIEDYSRLLEQAVVQANSAIATRFDANPHADPIEITVLISRQGQILPVLMAEVSQDQWQEQPDIQSLVRYSNSVRILLGYAQPTPIASRIRPPVRRSIIVDADLTDDFD